ncbi:MAG: ATP-dependent Clp protease ATP-binding subunit [Acidobacteria bacterium]|nr:ATP-dependent Clp protease ATP-binding subunit [Acidobacteriota bacterium]
MSLFEKIFGTNDPAKPSAEASLEVSIYDLAKGVADHFGEVAHPSELARHQPWSDAVAKLASSPSSDADLFTYALGENAVVASLALLALAHRSTSETVPFLLEHIDSLSGSSTKYFALDVLDRLVPVPEPLLGSLFVALNDDWSDGYDRFLSQFIRELARRRTRAGESATFGDRLPNVSTQRLRDVDALLRRLGSEVSESFRDELDEFRNRTANVDFLRHIGVVWSDDMSHPPIVEHERLRNAASTIVSSLDDTPRRSVLVIGEDGVGKTTIIRTAARELHAKGWVVFEAGATDILSGQSYIGQLEERMRTVLQSVRGEKRVLWIIPRFYELLHAGTHRYSGTGLLDMILPEIDAGTIAVVGEISLSGWQKLVEQKRRVRTSLLNIRIDSMNDGEARSLARRWAMERANGAEILPDDVLSETFQLTTQYLGMRAAPGNILDTLGLTFERMSRIAEPIVPLAIDDILVTLSQLTGLPNSILDDRESLDLTVLRETFVNRVLGQPEAVDTLVERVAMIKAGVTDPKRPFGVFLFAGPTGTGKTEIAKTLAEFLFGSADRMIRLDMSELKASDSMGRLLGDNDTGEGATSLVDEIRKQPFSVVLLDEFEKAHPNVWDLFLQIFDDGRLTDRRGLTADFRHALIIMTSNIGSAIQTSGRVGFSDAEIGLLHSSRVIAAIERELRKEFINRIDRVVVFRPLSRETMRGILRKEIAEAFQRRGLRNRSWAVEWDEAAIDLLLECGFTHDLGARPLRRAVERYLLTPLAERIVSRRVPSGDQFLFIRAEEDRLAIDFVDPDASAPARALAEPVTGGDSLQRLALAAAGRRDELELLRASLERLGTIVGSDVWKERKTIALQMTSLAEFWSSPERFEILGDVEMRDRIESALDSAHSLLGRLTSHDRAAPAELARRLAQQIWLIGIAIADLEERRSAEAILVVECRGGTNDASRDLGRKLANMYESWARGRRMRFEKAESATPSRWRWILLASGFGAHTLLAPETGVHVLESPGTDPGSVERATAHVRVVAVRRDAPSEHRATLIQRADRHLDGTADSPTIVRRYREIPSPLVRDAVRNWKTGRADLVFGGAFDLIASDAK